MKSSRVQVQANSPLAALKNNNYLFHLSKSSKLQQLRLKRRPRKISETDLLRRKTPEEIWKESWQDMLWHDGTEPLKSSCSRKITVPVSTCGQLVVFSLNFLEWWKKVPQPTLIVDLSSLVSHAFLFHPTGVRAFKQMVSQLTRMINWLWFLRYLGLLRKMTLLLYFLQI